MGFLIILKQTTLISLQHYGFHLRTNKVIHAAVPHDASNAVSNGSCMSFCGDEINLGWSFLTRCSRTLHFYDGQFPIFNHVLESVPQSCYVHFRLWIIIGFNYPFPVGW